MTRFEPSATLSLPIAGRANKGWFFRLTQTVGLWEQRRKLAKLDDAALRDIGLTRDEAVTEAERPLWDVPANWLR